MSLTKVIKIIFIEKAIIFIYMDLFVWLETEQPRKTLYKRLKDIIAQTILTW